MLDRLLAEDIRRDNLPRGNHRYTAALLGVAEQQLGHMAPAFKIVDKAAFEEVFAEVLRVGDTMNTKPTRYTAAVVAVCLLRSWSAT